MATPNNAVSSTGPAAFGVIAERFRRAGQPEKAVTLCREGLEKFPEHLSARVTLGWSLLDLGEFQEAFDQLKSVLKRAPDNLAAIRGLAELHERGIGLVFDAFTDNDDSADLDPMVEPELPMFVAAPTEPAPAPVLVPVQIEDAMERFEPVAEAEPVRFEIEDVIDVVDADPMFDLSGVFAADPDPEGEPEPQPEPVRARVPMPISMFARAPLALRDDTDAERVDELNDWLSRVRDRQSDSVSQYMAG